MRHAACVVASSGESGRPQASKHGRKGSTSGRAEAGEAEGEGRQTKQRAAARGRSSGNTKRGAKGSKRAASQARERPVPCRSQPR